MPDDGNAVAWAEDTVSESPVPTTTKGTRLTDRGLRTRHRLLEAAEQVFAQVGYPEASIVKITEAAGCGLGTFYLYFAGKQEIFDEVVAHLNRRVRRAMSEAAQAETGRLASERAGFRAFFRFTAEHPALYRIVRQAEFASPGALRQHYTKIVEGYTLGLTRGQESGQVRPTDPEVAAWALMGIGEIVGMRWVLWPAQGLAEGTPGTAGVTTDGAGAPGIPEEVFEAIMQFIERALAPEPAGRPAPGTGPPQASQTPETPETMESYESIDAERQDHDH